MDCSICLNNISENFTSLDCDHKFCNHCICEWIEKNKLKTCPNCRCDITKMIIVNNGETTEKIVTKITSFNEILNIFHIEKSVFADLTDEEINGATAGISKLLKLEDNSEVGDFMSLLVKNIVTTIATSDENVNILDIASLVTKNMSASTSGNKQSFKKIADSIKNLDFDTMAQGTNTKKLD